MDTMDTFQSRSTTDSDQKLSLTHYDDPFPHSPHLGCTGPWDDESPISKDEEHYLLGPPMIRPEGNVSFESLDLEKELEHTIMLFSGPQPHVQKAQKAQMSSANVFAVSPRMNGRTALQSENAAS
jgi:hypothetical protein